MGKTGSCNKLSLVAAMAALILDSAAYESIPPTTTMKTRN